MGPKRYPLDTLLQVLEKTTALGLRKKGQFQAYCGGWSAGLTPNIENVWGCDRIENGLNFMAYCNPRADSLNALAVKLPMDQARPLFHEVQRLVEFVGMGLAVGISGFLLYLPFYVGFSSQAGGVLPSMAFFTRGAHLWVMFGPLLIPIFIFLIYLWTRRRDWLPAWAVLLAPPASLALSGNGPAQPSATRHLPRRVSANAGRAI